MLLIYQYLNEFRWMLYCYFLSIQWSSLNFFVYQSFMNCFKKSFNTNIKITFVADWLSCFENILTLQSACTWYFYDIIQLAYLCSCQFKEAHLCFTIILRLCKEKPDEIQRKFFAIIFILIFFSEFRGIWSWTCWSQFTKELCQYKGKLMRCRQDISIFVVQHMYISD